LLGIVEVFELVMIGLFAGFVGGMLGVGGSIVMIPAMTEVLGPNQHLYQAAAMIVNFFVVVPAVYQHRRARAIDGATVARIIPLAIVAVIIGVGLSELPLFAGAGEAYLRGLFGLFLFAVAVSDLYRLLRPTNRQSTGLSNTSPTLATENRAGWIFAAAVAIPTGLVAGLLGVGGGVLAVPLQRRFLRVPIRIAIANSATIIIATSSVGAIAKNYAYVTEHDHSLKPFVLAALLIPTAMIGSLAGSRLTHRAPLTFVKVAFFALLLVAGVRLTYKAARSVSRPAPEALLTQSASECSSVLHSEPRDLSLTRGSRGRSSRSEAAPRVKDSARADIDVRTSHQNRSEYYTKAECAPADDPCPCRPVAMEWRQAGSTFSLRVTDTSSRRESRPRAAPSQSTGVKYEQSTYLRAMVSSDGSRSSCYYAKWCDWLCHRAGVPRGSRPGREDRCHTNREWPARRPVCRHRA